jgi:hypothetical protein
MFVEYHYELYKHEPIRIVNHESIKTKEVSQQIQEGDLSPKVIAITSHTLCLLSSSLETPLRKRNTDIDTRNLMLTLR